MPQASEVRLYVCVCEFMLEEAWDLRSHGEEKYSPREERRTAETNLSDYLAAGEKVTCQITQEFCCAIAFICNSYLCVGEGWSVAPCLSQVSLVAKTRLLSFQGTSCQFVNLRSFLPASMIDRQSNQAYSTTCI